MSGKGPTNEIAKEIGKKLDTKPIKDKVSYITPGSHTPLSSYKKSNASNNNNNGTSNTTVVQHNTTSSVQEKVPNTPTKLSFKKLSDSFPSNTKPGLHSPYTLLFGNKQPPLSNIPIPPPLPPTPSVLKPKESIRWILNSEGKWIKSTVSQTTICENDKVKVMKSASGKEYPTSITESTNVSDVTDEYIINELAKRELIKEDSTPEVTVKLHVGEHTFQNIGIKFSQLGQAYFTVIESKKDIALFPNQINNNDIEFQIIITT